MSMGTRRWLNQTQPQTLQIAVFLMYLDAVFMALFGAILDPIGILFIAAYVGAGYGIANERKWGYWLGLAIATLTVVFLGLAFISDVRVLQGSALTFMFAIAKFALLVHPHSAEYQRIWFK